MFFKLFKTPPKKNTLIEPIFEPDFHFFKVRNDLGTFGIFDDYPDCQHVLNQLIENHVSFKNESRARRSKNSITVNQNGKTTSLFIKGKVLNCFVVRGMLQKNYPYLRELFLNDFSSVLNQKKQFSVLNELLVNRIITYRYEKKFKKSLLIEKPIGFFISSRSEDKGARWVIFEEIQNIMLDDSVASLEGEEYQFQKVLKSELREIGLINFCFKTLYDVVYVGDMQNHKFIIVDSEEWKIKRSG